MPNTISSITFRVNAPVGNNERIAVIGSTPELGNWDTSKAIPLECTADSFPLWFTPRPVFMKVPSPVTYKYIITNTDGQIRSELIDQDRILNPTGKDWVTDDVLNHYHYTPPSSSSSQQQQHHTQNNNHTTTTNNYQHPYNHRDTGLTVVVPPEIGSTGTLALPSSIPISSSGSSTTTMTSQPLLTNDMIIHSSSTHPSMVPTPVSAGGINGTGSFVGNTNNNLSATSSSSSTDRVEATTSSSSTTNISSTATRPSVSSRPTLTEADGVLIVEYRLPIRLYKRTVPVETPLSTGTTTNNANSTTNLSSLVTNGSSSGNTAPQSATGNNNNSTISTPISPSAATANTAVNTFWVAEWDEEALLAPKGSMSRALGQIRVKWIGTPPIHVPPDEEEAVTRILEPMRCIPVFLPPAAHAAYYDGFCRDTLWPIFHNVIDVYGEVPTRWWIAGRQSDRWKAYMDANQRFATAVVEHFHDGDMVWVQDYHLLLVPNLLARRHIAPVGLFLHVPFPSSEIFRTLSVREELLKSILAADHVGFHLFEYARHFLTSCRRLLGLTHSSRRGGCLSIDYQGREVMVTVTQVGIEPEYMLRRITGSPMIVSSTAEWKALFPNRKIMVGVDSIERLRGVPHKLLAFEKLLEKNPELAETTVLVQLCVEDTARPGDKQETTVNEIRSLATRINARFMKPNNVSVVHLVIRSTSIPLSERMALWLAADIFVSTTIRDSRALHAFEYVYARGSGKCLPAAHSGAIKGMHDNKSGAEQALDACKSLATYNLSPGALILSEFSGSSRVLSGCFRVSPWQLDGVVAAMHHALTMSPEESEARAQANLQYVVGNTTSAWAERVLLDLKSLARRGSQRTYMGYGLGLGYRLMGFGSSFRPLNVEHVLTAYRRSTNRLIVCDYGGTLNVKDSSSIRRQAFEMGLLLGKDAAPPLTAETKKALRILADDPRNTVFVISGKEKEVLQQAFASLPNVGLAAEQGFYYRWGAPSAKRTSSTPSTVGSKTPKVKPLTGTSIPPINVFSYPNTSSTSLTSDSPREGSVNDSDKGDENATANMAQPPSGDNGMPWLTLLTSDNQDWKPFVSGILETYAARTNGTYILRKSSSMSWHYGDADTEFGTMQAKELQDHLSGVVATSGYSVDVVSGHDYVEVRPKGVSKGIVLGRIIDTLEGRERGKKGISSNQQPPPPPSSSSSASSTKLSSIVASGTDDGNTTTGTKKSRPLEFILCIGDDLADEDMFATVVSYRKERWVEHQQRSNTVIAHVSTKKANELFGGIDNKSESSMASSAKGNENTNKINKASTSSLNGSNSMNNEDTSGGYRISHFGVAGVLGTVPESHTPVTPVLGGGNSNKHGHTNVSLPPANDGTTSVPPPVPSVVPTTHTNKENETHSRNAILSGSSNPSTGAIIPNNNIPLAPLTYYEYTVTVGRKPSTAQYFLDDTQQTEDLLKTLARASLARSTRTTGTVSGASANTSLANNVTGKGGSNTVSNSSTSQLKNRSPLTGIPTANNNNNNATASVSAAVTAARAAFANSMQTGIPPPGMDANQFAAMLAFAGSTTNIAGLNTNIVFEPSLIHSLLPSNTGAPTTNNGTTGMVINGLPGTVPSSSQTTSVPSITTETIAPSITVPSTTVIPPPSVPLRISPVTHKPFQPSFYLPASVLDMSGMVRGTNNGSYHPTLVTSASSSGGNIEATSSPNSLSMNNTPLIPGVAKQAEGIRAGIPGAMAALYASTSRLHGLVSQQSSSNPSNGMGILYDNNGNNSIHAPGSGNSMHRHLSYRSSGYGGSFGASDNALDQHNTTQPSHEGYGDLENENLPSEDEEDDNVDELDDEDDGFGGNGILHGAPPAVATPSTYQPTNIRISNNNGFQPTAFLGNHGTTTNSPTIIQRRTMSVPSLVAVGTSTKTNNNNSNNNVGFMMGRSTIPTSTLPGLPIVGGNSSWILPTNTNGNSSMKNNNSNSSSSSSNSGGGNNPNVVIPPMLLRAGSTGSLVRHPSSSTAPTSGLGQYFDGIAEANADEVLEF